MKILHPIGYKLVVLLLFCTLSGISYGQHFAPSLTTLYQDNSLQPGQRYGVDMKYFAILPEHKEIFIAWTYAAGENNYSDSDLIRLSMGCKTGDKLKYGAMMSAIGYLITDYGESSRDQMVASIAFSPLISYDITKYFYIESGMSVTAFQTGDFVVMNSYFLSLGMRWWQ